MAKAKEKPATRASKIARTGKQRKGATLSGAAGAYAVCGKEFVLTVIQPMKTKHGLRPRGGKNEFIQRAIQQVCGGIPPANVSVSWLWREVNDWLEKNPEYRRTRLGKVSRRTIQRVLKRMGSLLEQMRS